MFEGAVYKLRNASRNRGRKKGCFVVSQNFVRSVEVKLLIIEFEIRKFVPNDLKRPNS